MWPPASTQRSLPEQLVEKLPLSGGEMFGERRRRYAEGFSNFGGIRFSRVREVPHLVGRFDDLSLAVCQRVGVEKLQVALVALPVRTDEATHSETLVSVREFGNDLTQCLDTGREESDYKCTISRPDLANGTPPTLDALTDATLPLLPFEPVRRMFARGENRLHVGVFVNQFGVVLAAGSELFSQATLGVRYPPGDADDGGTVPGDGSDLTNLRPLDGQFGTNAIRHVVSFGHFSFQSLAEQVRAFLQYKEPQLSGKPIMQCAELKRIVTSDWDPDYTQT